MTSPTESSVRFDRFTVAYQQAVGIEDVSFELSPGEFLGVVGPNGSGKTTLLRAVLGLVRPVSGRVTVLFALATLFSPKRRKCEVCGHDSGV